MHLVVYDISDKRRLRRVASICERCLTRVQKSVFEGELSKSQVFILQKELKREIKKSEDSIFIYFITRASIKKKIRLGKELDDEFIIV